MGEHPLVRTQNYAATPYGSIIFGPNPVRMASLPLSGKQAQG